LTLAKSLSHLAKINPIWQTTAELQGKKALLSKIDFIKKKKKTQCLCFGLIGLNNAIKKNLSLIKNQ
jgi:hypothetical protein